MFILLFLILAIAILFGSHYFLYFSIIRFFSVTDTSAKIVLIGILFSLAISFILSSTLAHWRDNVLTREFYFISGFWLGLLTNLVLLFAIAWLGIWLFHLLDKDPDLPITGGIFIFLAITFSIYGTWNALHPQIKSISVTIPGLSDEWHGKKIVQLSDLHLGHIYRQKFMQSAVKKINAENPEMIVITGDLFDGMDGSIDSLVKPLDEARPSKGIYFITGNHETYLGIDKALSALSKTKVTTLKDQVVDIDGLKLIGINYPAQGEKKDIVAMIQSLQPSYLGQPNILLYHSPVEIAKISTLGINLELCGHTHKGQLIPFGFITSLIYKGYDHGLFPMGDYTLYVTNGTGTWGPTMRTGNTPEIVSITLE
jgi:uncharacterized protein